MTKINGVEIRNPQNKNEQRWFSFLSDKLEEIDFGTVEFKMTIKSGKVTAIKIIKGEENFNISENF